MNQALTVKTNVSKLDTVATPSVEAVLKEQLAQWQSVKRHASREIAKIEAQLKTPK